MVSERLQYSTCTCAHLKCTCTYMCIPTPFPLFSPSFPSFLSPVPPLSPSSLPPLSLSDYVDNSDPESEESGFSQRRRNSAARKSTRLAVAFDPGTSGLPSGEEGGGKVRGNTCVIHNVHAHVKKVIDALLLLFLVCSFPDSVS